MFVLSFTSFPLIVWSRIWNSYYCQINGTWYHIMRFYTTWSERKNSSQDLETKFCCCLLQSVTAYWHKSSCWQSAQGSAEASPQPRGIFWAIISGIKIYEVPIVLLVFSHLRTLASFVVDKRFPCVHDFSSMLVQVCSDE